MSRLAGSVALACVSAACAGPLSNELLQQLYGTREVAPRQLRTLKNASQTLRQAAAVHGLYVGYASNYHHLTDGSDPNYVTVGNANYNLATAENACKFGQTEPSRGQPSFEQCDAVKANIVDKAGGVFRGHNWIWGQDNPDWLQKGSFSAAELQEILKDHITAVGTHYGTSAYAWDVVNEAVSDDQNSSVIFKDSVWYPKLPSFVDDAFRVGRQVVGPSVKLFYNDYGAEGLGTKSDKVYNMVKGMLSRGVPIDGVGMQMHVSTQWSPSRQDVSSNIARLCALGLEVHITEMDVRCLPAPCDAAGLQTQAQVYGDILKACLDNKCCKNFETWGFTDKYTWLWDFQNPDHLDMKPLPFDGNYQPKPAYFELLATLQQAPPQPITV